jgi:hypothetical protein
VKIVLGVVAAALLVLAGGAGGYVPMTVIEASLAIATSGRAGLLARPSEMTGRAA